MELNGSHVLVTGASRGIGAAMAREFNKRGASLSLVARSAADLEALATELDGHAFVADLTDRSEVDDLIARVETHAGPIDVLVNNAGIETSTSFHRTDVDSIRAVLNLNLDAPLVLTRQVLDGMIERNRGHLVYISSLVATGGFPGMAPYAASKAGLTNFAASIDMELKGTNIHTTVVAPGPVDTPMWDQLEDSADTVPVLARLGKLRMLPKAEPQKIATVAVDAVERDRGYVGLPKRLGLNHVLRNTPSTVTKLILKGVRVGPELNG